MRRRVLHHLLFLWLHLYMLSLVPVVSDATRTVEVVCGDFSTLDASLQLNSDVQDGDIDIIIHHPAMPTGTVDLVEGMQYTVQFTSRLDIMEVQGVALIASPTARTTSKTRPPADIPGPLASWPRHYRCDVQSSHPFTPSPVQTPSSPSLSELAAQHQSTAQNADEGSEPFASELDVTSSTSSSSASSSSSSSIRGRLSPRPMSTSADDDVSSTVELLATRTSSSSPFALSSSSATSSALLSSALSSPSSISTPMLEATLPTGRFNEHVPFSLLWTADTVTSPCLTLTFLLMVNSSFCILKSQELCKPRGCKQYFTSETGVLQSPGYPGSYPDSADCTYIIYTRPPSTIELQMFRLENSYSELCVDSVTVTHVQSDDQVVLCGEYNVTQLRQLYFVSSNQTLVLHFVSDNKFSSTGFRALYATAQSKACDETHKRLNDTIRSPVRPPVGTYLPNMLCHYSIYLPASYRLRFYLRRLNFSDSVTGTCTQHDFLHFRDLHSQNQAKVTCYDNLTAGDLIFESSGSHVRLMFASDHVIQGDGFEVYYVGVPSCGNETFRQPSGTVVSVNFPHHYPNMQECFYTVNLTSEYVLHINGDTPSFIDLADYDDIIEVTFREFFTESEFHSHRGRDVGLRDALCLRDYVEMYDGREKHRVCGDWTGMEHLLYYRFRSAFVMFRFVSDEQETRRGFNATWRTLRGDNSTSCLSTWVNKDHFSFQVVYNAQIWQDAQKDCLSRGGHLASIFTNTTQQLLNQHILHQSCSEAKAYWIGANDRQWESDFYWTNGAKISFTNWFPGVARPGHTEQKYGHQPSDDGQADEDCVELRRHFALPDKGQFITQSFYWNDRNCMRKNPYICQIKPVSTPVQRLDCDRKVTLSTWHPEVRLHSPGYPRDPYPDHLNCSVFLHAPPGHMLEFEFWDFQLENASLSGRCEYDHMEVSAFPRGKLLAGHRRKKCGDWSKKVKLLRHTVTSFYAFLQLQTDHSKRFRGFDVSVRILQDGCPNGSWVPVTFGCVFVIAKEMDSHTAQNRCSSVSASLWAPETDIDLPVVLSHLLAVGDTSGGAGIPKIAVMDTDDQKCMVVAVAGSDVIDNVTVVTDVTKSGVSCDEKAGLFFACLKPTKLESLEEQVYVDASESTEGQLQPPLDDDGTNYTNDAAITWHLQAPPGHRLLLLLSNVDVEQQRDCLYDRIVMRNATPPEPVCGTLEEEKAVVSENDSVEVSFFSDYSRTGKAFTLTWQSLSMATQCTNRSFTETSATFSSFNFPRPFPDLVSCHDVIVVPEGFRVQLEFSHIHFQHASPRSITLDLGGRGRTGEMTVGTEDDEDGALKKVFLSEGNILKVKLKRDVLLRGEGFQAVYRTVSHPFDLRFDKVSLKPNSSTTFLSPNYPLSVPDNVSFNYTLRAPIGYNIHVTFHHIRLRATYNCSEFMDIFDVSLVSEKPVLLLRLCGEGPANNTVSALNRIMIAFASAELAPTEREKRSLTMNDVAPVFNISFIVSPDPEYLEKTNTLQDTSFDSCAEEPCQNNGTCLQRDEEASCSCPLHYSGLFCQVTWCEAQNCLHGDCELIEEMPGYHCHCWPGHFGTECRLSSSQCRTQVCHNAGQCQGNSSHLQCVCDRNTPQVSGPFCNVTSSSLGLQMTIGQRLLGEPIWIGLIVILSVLLLFGVVCVVRRRCAKRYACCQIQFKRKDPANRGGGDRKKGATDGAHPLATFHARRHMLRLAPSATPAVATKTTTAATIRATPTISIIKPDEEVVPAAAAKSCEQLKAEVAARFFASYREAERAPISTPLPTDFSKPTDTFLAQSREENAVGAIVGGTLLHDLHHRKTREDFLSRSSLSLTHINRRSSGGSSYSHRDRIRRCHSLGGLYKPRKDSMGASQECGYGYFESSPKPRSMAVRDSLWQSSDRNEVLLSPREIRSISASPRANRKSWSEFVTAGGKTQQSKTDGEESSHHLFPEVIVCGHQDQRAIGDTSDSSEEETGRKHTQSVKQSKYGMNMSRIRTGSANERNDVGRPHENHVETKSVPVEIDYVMGNVMVPEFPTDIVIRYADERSPPAKKKPSRNTRSEYDLSPRRVTSRTRSVDEDDFSSDSYEVPARRHEQTQFLHQLTVDNSVRQKPKYHRAQTYTEYNPRMERPKASMKRSCTGPKLAHYLVNENGSHHPRIHYDQRKSVRDDRRQKREMRYDPKDYYNPLRDPSRRSLTELGQIAGCDPKRSPRDLSQQISKQNNGKQSSRERRGMFKRNETVAVSSASRPRKSRSRWSSHAIRIRKCSSVDLVRTDQHPLPPRSHSEELLGRFQSEECVSDDSSRCHSHSSRLRCKSDSSSGKRHRTRCVREKGVRDRGHVYRGQSAHSYDTTAWSSHPYTTSDSLSSKLDPDFMSMKTSSSENEKLFPAACRVEQLQDSSCEGKEVKHRGIDALGSSFSDKDLEISRGQLFMKFFSQEVDLDDSPSSEHTRCLIGTKPCLLERDSCFQAELNPSQRVLANRTHFESAVHNPGATDVSSEPSSDKLVDPNSTTEGGREQLTVTRSQASKVNMLTSKCSVIMYDDDVRSHSGTLSLAVSNNVSPKRLPNPVQHQDLFQDRQAVVISVETSACPAVAVHNEPSSAGSESLQPRHSDPASLLSVTDTDSAVSSAASQQTSPCSDVVYMSSGTTVTQSRTMPKAQDSAYQTKESSMDIFETWRDTRRRKSLPTQSRVDERKVSQRLQQAALKLLILQQRARKGRLSRDSAVNTISEDETAPDGEDLVSHGYHFRYRKQMALPDIRYLEETEGEGEGIREEEERESDLDFIACLNPTPETLPMAVENIVEEPCEGKECEA